MPGFKKRKNMKMKITEKKCAGGKGFTLIELLVVIAIIAVIGAGVAVTYQKLDDQAKTAMEISDMAALKKVVKHWSAVNDYALPDEFDSLVDEDGNLFELSTTPYGMGLDGPIGYATLEVHDAPDVVLENLDTAGMNFTYLHRVDATTANDSTFDGGVGGYEVDTTRTRAAMATGGSDARIDAAEMVNDGGGASGTHDYLVGPYSFTTATNGTVFGPFATEADWLAEQANQQLILDSPETDQLAFVYPGGGLQVPGVPNFTEEIITNAGLRPEQVADPSVPTASLTTEKYYLVVMGFGRFCSIYRGKSVRADAPSYGKREKQSDKSYSRYLAVIRVPVEPYSTFSGSSEAPVVADVLSPQGYSGAALRDKFIDDQERIQDDT